MSSLKVLNKFSIRILCKSFTNSCMQDTKYKREYLDNAQNWVTITVEENDESDKHLEV